MCLRLFWWVDRASVCVSWQTIFHLLSIKMSRSKLEISLNENLNADKLNEKHSEMRAPKTSLKPIKVSNFHLRIPFAKENFDNDNDDDDCDERQWRRAGAATTHSFLHFRFFPLLRRFSVLGCISSSAPTSSSLSFSADTKFLSGNEVNRCFIPSVLCRFRFSARAEKFVN